MKVLIACEFSGIVRDAFKEAGHDAWSLDLLPTEKPGQHIQQELFGLWGAWNLPTDFDLMIAHPECKYLCFSGERWIKERPERIKKRNEAFEFFMNCINAPVPLICVENSHSVFLNKKYRKPDQTIHPYHFGDPFKKSTCLWLKGLPPLVPSNILPIGKRYPACHQEGPSKDRSKNRSRTYEGIAKAMAEQWGKIELKKSA